MNMQKPCVSKECHKRSMVKSILWRLLGVVVLAVITFIVTRNWIQTSIITIAHHGSFIVLYYLHERFWLHYKNFVGKKRMVLRVFTYEIVLGNLVLGAITWLVTGSWLSVSLITPIYIGNKLWIYVVYDRVWNKIKWGCT